MNQRKSTNTNHRSYDDMVSTFLNEAGSFELLSKPDEAELFTIIDNGIELFQSLPNLDNLTLEQEELLIRTAAAQQVVFVTNQRLVFDRAKKYSFLDGPWTMDLTQQGMIGLFKGIARFDIKTSNAFSTYATWWIDSEVRRYIGNASRTIRIPVHMHDKWIKMTSIVKGLTLNLGHEPTDAEIEKATGLKIKDYQDLMRNGKNQLASLNASTREDIDKDLGEYVADPNADSDAYIDHVSNMEELKKILITSDLSDREKFVIGLRFGLDGIYFDDLTITVKSKTIHYKAAKALMGEGSGYTLEQIGTMFGLTRERVRQIESSGVKGLREAHMQIARSFNS